MAVTVMFVLIVLNLIGGCWSWYRSAPFYWPSMGIILVAIVVLYISGAQ